MCQNVYQQMHIQVISVNNTYCTVILFTHVINTLKIISSETYCFD